MRPGILLTLLSLLSLLPLSTFGEKEPSKVYVPVSSASILHAALESNLSLVRQWLRDKDFPSAAQTARGLDVLADLYAHQSDDPAWRKRAARLQSLGNTLIESCMKKDVKKANEARLDLEKELKKLAGKTPKKENQPVKDYRPSSAPKTWMLLMDGAYSDSKIASTGKEMARYALEIAEEANALIHMRSAARWQELARSVRDTALEVAKAIKSSPKNEARQQMKRIYQRCTACHNNYRR